jgi:hypothetical protein
MRFCSDHGVARSWTVESSLDQRTITFQIRQKFSECFEGRPDNRTVARSCLTTVHRRALDMGVKGQPYEVFDGRSVLATTAPGRRQAGLCARDCATVRYGHKLQTLGQLVSSL